MFAAETSKSGVTKTKQRAQAAEPNGNAPTKPPHA
jgi:hypothetical protein